MSEFGKIMRKTKSNMAKLSNGKFGTGAFVFLEEKVPGKKDVRRVLYVSKPVKEAVLNENKAAEVGTIGAANSLFKRLSPGLKPFANGSALAAGFIHKSPDAKTLLLKVAVSKGCSESKLKKGLAALEKQHKGNAFTKMIRYKAGFKAGEALVESGERPETLARRNQTKATTKKAPKDPAERVAYYERLLDGLVEGIRQAVDRAMGVDQQMVEADQDGFLDLRDTLEEAAVYLRKYEQAQEKNKGVSKYPGLYDQSENAHAHLSALLVGERSEFEEYQQSDSLKTKAAKAVKNNTGVEAAGKGRAGEAVSKMVDATLKAEKLAMQGLEQGAKLANATGLADAAGEAASAVSMVSNIKKTVESGVRIARAEEAKRTLRGRFDQENARVEQKRITMDLQRPDPTADVDAYNEWVRKRMRLTSEVDAMEHLVQIQNSIEQKSAFDMLEGTLSIASNALTLSGVGGGAGMAVKGAAYGVKAGRKVGEKIRDSKRESKSEERQKLVGKDAAHKLMRNTDKSRRNSGREGLFEEERINAMALNEAQRKMLDEMNHIRALRNKATRGEMLSMRERWKVSTSANEDASKGVQLMKKSETARAIVSAAPETQAMMLKCIGIQVEEWAQLKAAAKQKLMDFRGTADEINEKKDKDFKRMLAEVLSVAIPSI